MDKELRERLIDVVRDSWAVDAILTEIDAAGYAVVPKRQGFIKTAATITNEPPIR